MVEALVLEAPRTLRRRKLPMPDVGDDDGILRVEACGLCGTDHELYTGAMVPGFPFVPGHEAVGIIEAVGDRAAERWGVQEGDRVAVEVFLSCRSCDACRRGTYRRCERHGLADMYGMTSIDKPPGLWGGVALARTGGTMVVAGTRGGGAVPGFDPDVVVYKELRIQGALGVDVVAYRAAFELLASGRYPFADLPRRVVGLDGLEELLETMAGERGVPPVHAVVAPSRRSGGPAG